MNDFMAFAGPFAWGLVVGYFGHPVWQILKKIWAEAKKTREEW